MIIPSLDCITWSLGHNTRQAPNPMLSVPSRIHAPRPCTAATPCSAHAHAISCPSAIGATSNILPTHAQHSRAQQQHSCLCSILCTIWALSRTAAAAAKDTLLCPFGWRNPVKRHTHRHRHRHSLTVERLPHPGPLTSRGACCAQPTGIAKNTEQPAHHTGAAGVSVAGPLTQHHPQTLSNAPKPAVIAVTNWVTGTAVSMCIWLTCQSS